MYERLIKLLNDVGSPRVLLVGDFMLDNYLYGNADRISPEAPVVVINVVRRQERPGGAGSVAVDMATLKLNVECLGIVGNDSAGIQLKRMLAKLGGVNIEGLLGIDERPTTSKQRIIGLAQQRHRQQLMRIDEEDNSPISTEVQNKLNERLEKLIDKCDVVCIEDYNKGVLSSGFCQTVIKAARKAGKKTIVDPARVSDYSRYAGCWLVKPNRYEIASAAGVKMDGEETWQLAAEKLTSKYNMDNVVITLDKQGAFLYQRQVDNSQQQKDKGELIPTRPRSVYDVTGAGDMVLSVLGMLVGGKYEKEQSVNLREAVAMANIAGGLEVERFGSVGISREEIAAELARQRRTKTGKLRTLGSLISELNWLRQQKMKVVFTNGCFDILHPGHIELLSFAKQQGDILIVAINSDNSVRKLKGNTRPILKQQERAALLSAMEAVDYVVVFDEPDPGNLIEQITPDVLVKGTDWQGNVVGQQWVEQHGGKVVLMDLVEGRSTTGIIERVINTHLNNDK